MITHTKGLFSSILKALDADGVCDIGSRDGDQALLFRHLLPGAVVVAFEANPINYQKMAAREVLKASRIEIVPKAVAQETGQLPFHVTDVDYSDPNENIGTSSLLVHEGLRIKETVLVPVCRMDDFILGQHPTLRRMGLWIDVEGAEYAVIQGMERIKDRVLTLHVETAREPMRRGQKTYHEVAALLDGMGFEPCGSNLGRRSVWGDVVFVNRSARQALGLKWPLLKARALATHWLRADAIAVFLKGRLPWLYRFLRKIYLRLGT